MIDSDLRGR